MTARRGDKSPLPHRCYGQLTLGARTDPAGQGDERPEDSSLRVVATEALLRRWCGPCGPRCRANVRDRSTSSWGSRTARNGSGYARAGEKHGFWRTRCMPRRGCVTGVPASPSTRRPRRSGRRRRSLPADGWHDPRSTYRNRSHRRARHVAIAHDQRHLVEGDRLAFAAAKRLPRFSYLKDGVAHARTHNGERREGRAPRSRPSGLVRSAGLPAYCRYKRCNVCTIR
jgi:hypothetical protein